MNRSNLFALLSACLLVIPGARAQSIEVQPSLATAQAQYRDAEETWIKADPNLEADLYGARPSDMRLRIRRAAGLRDEVMQKKLTFLNFMVSRFDELQNRMGASKTLSTPTQDFRKDVEDEHTRLRDEQDRAEQRLRELPKSKEYSQVRYTIEAEQSALLNLQTTIERRVHALEELSKAQEKTVGQAQTDDLTNKVAELRKIWESERERCVRSRKSWANYYDELEKSLGKKTLPKRSRTP